MNWLLLTTGLIIVGLTFYIKYLRADRDIVKNDLDLYKNLHTIEKEHVNRLEQNAFVDEERRRNEPKKDIPDLVTSLRGKLSKDKGSSS